MFQTSPSKIVLASKSPRRQELIKQISSNLEIRIQDVAEIYDANLAPEKVPEYLAKLKADALFSTLKADEIIVSADTIVILENKILEKPRDLEHAKEMLRELSGKKHQVITGCCLMSSNKTILFSNTTAVYFKKLSPESISYYVNTFKPLDKAGSYGIQEWIGMIGIEKIDGCYYNVMGLPVSQLMDELEKMN